MADTYDTLLIPAASQSFVDPILGPPIVGWTLNLMVYSIMISTLFNYVGSERYTKDGRGTRWTMWTVVALASVDSALSFESLYHYATWQVRDSNTLFNQTPVDCFATFWVGIEGAIVQIFLSRRASALFTNRIYKATFFFFLGAGIACGAFGSVLYLVLSELLRANKLESALPLSFPIATGMWLWGCAFVDVLVTLTLCTLLYQRIAGFNARTDGALRKIVRFSIETCSYTATFALMGAILTYAFPADSLHSNSGAAFWLVLSPVYALALITTLNSRGAISEEAGRTTNHSSLPVFGSPVSYGGNHTSFNFTVTGDPSSGSLGGLSPGMVSLSMGSSLKSNRSITSLGAEAGTSRKKEADPDDEIEALRDKHCDNDLTFA